MSDEKMKAHALPCPFCGGEEITRREDHGDERVGYNSTIEYRCNGCGAVVRTSTRQDSGGWISKDNADFEQRALSKWNSRAADAKCAELEAYIKRIEDGSKGHFTQAMNNGLRASQAEEERDELRRRVAELESEEYECRDQERIWADAEMRARIAELEQSADLHYKSHAAAIAKLAESEKRVAELEARLHDIADSCRIVYGKVPSLPLTDETMSAGTDALHEFCLLVGIHNIDISDDAIGAEGGT